MLEYPFACKDLLDGEVFAFAGGLLTGILALGLTPIMEATFRYSSNIRLLELLNLDQPILRELMLVAPGTYHHSLVVGQMVEAAAETIGANPMLAKAAAYYHDVGKIKKPVYFVENQMAGENKHEKLAPSMSSLILIAHVKDGVELARKHHLGEAIVDIIRQHHGTSFISYFYHKAKTQAANPQQVKIEDYRYPGPRPQTKEAGLVLLADQVEAASKTLTEPTPARIQGMVQKIINNVFADGQLDECELTLKDLHHIAKSFNKILGGIFHQRIQYPQSVERKRSMKIWISNRQRKTAINPERVRKRAGKILSALGWSEAELSLTLLGDRAMARLNRETFGRRGPTNVISFPAGCETGGAGSSNRPACPANPVRSCPDQPPPLLGEVVISIETTRRQAKEFGWPWQELFDFFLIHGILHLMGYDHGTPEAEAAMTARTWELMRAAASRR